MESWSDISTWFDRIGRRQVPVWEENTFDLYVPGHLFDRLPETEPRHALEEMERVLVPDGYAFLVTRTTELDEIPWISQTFFG